MLIFASRCLVTHLACALCRSFPGILVARFFSGVGCSTFSTICGGVIADVYMADQRSFPMACFSTMALFGTGMGPLVSGFIAQNLSWRWIHWVQLIVNCVLMIIVVLVFKEPRGSVILIRKAKALNRFLDEHDSLDVEKSGPRVRWRVRAEEERTSLSAMIKVSLTRPFYFLFTEPVVFFFSVWVSFSWGVLYL
jgi:MFS family permease